MRQLKKDLCPHRIPPEPTYDLLGLCKCTHSVIFRILCTVVSYQVSHLPLEHVLFSINLDTVRVSETKGK